MDTKKNQIKRQILLVFKIYVQISYNGITKKDGKSTEVFSANGETYDITQKLDVSASITEDDITQLFT